MIRGRPRRGGCSIWLEDVMWRCKATSPIFWYRAWRVGENAKWKTAYSPGPTSTKQSAAIGIFLKAMDGA